MRGCSPLNSFAAPSDRSSVQGLLRIRLTRSSHANVTTPFTDATAISTHRFACAATMRFSGPSETIRRNASACPTKPSTLKLTTGTDLAAPRRVTGDISAIVGAETLWIDVSVVDPGCHHYIERYRSNEVPDAAAKAMETAKRNHYSAVKDPRPLPPASIIPFVLETSGRLGPSALADQQRTHLLEVSILQRNQLYLCNLLR